MNKSNIITIICLVGIIVIGFWGTYPMINQLKNVNLQNSAKQSEIKLAEAKINNLNTLKGEFSKFQNQVKLLSVAAPTEDQMPEILVQVESLAKKSGLEVSSIQPSKTVGAEEAGISLSTKGSFSATLNFLQNLENNARPVQVKSINVASAKTGEVVSLSTSYNLGFLKAQ